MENLVSVQVKGNIGTIEDNLDLVENSIREKIKEYSAVVITEDNVKDGKKFLADIRKEKKALDDERKAIKKQWMVPYDAFEKRAKKIISLYDEPVRIINEQLEEFEKQRIETKRQEIESVYDFVKGNLAEWLPLNRIYNPKWENATYSGKKIREDMELLFDQMKMSIETVKSMNSEFEAEALKALKDTGSLQEAVARINELQKQKEWFAERARQEKELAEMKQQEQAESIRKPQEELKEPESIPECDMEAPFALERTLTVKVSIGENDFHVLKEFLEAANFEYEVMM
nr:MAG: protein of unknown function DUF1351 [Bacteriophage sp.]